MIFVTQTILCAKDYASASLLEDTQNFFHGCRLLFALYINRCLFA